MSRRPSPALTDAELRIMRGLWDLRAATVAEIIERMEQTDAAAPVPAYNSVLTVLGILERKGYVTHDKDGRAFTFRPTIDRTDARKSALANVLSKFFDDSPSLLILDLFKHEDLDPADLARIRAVLNDADQDSAKPRRKRRA